MRRLVRTILAAGTIAAGTIVLGAGPAGAVDAGDDASFRAAFSDVNETQINLTADIAMNCVSGTYVRNSTTALTINGNNHKIDATGCGTQLMLTFDTGALTLNNVTLTGGNYMFNGSVGGGGLQANSDVTLVNSAVSNNTVTSTSPMMISGAVGGGILMDPSDTLTLVNSTVSGNTATCSSTCGLAKGGGIDAGTIVLKNSTVTNNTASGAPFTEGGGIETAGNLTLVYSTVTNNAAANGGANIEDPISMTSFGSVVTSPQGGSTNCANVNVTTTHGFNFSDDNTCGFTASTDNQNPGNNPQLGALASNGGPTQTRMPQPGSPLINPIPGANCQDFEAAGVTSDQRGVFRPQGPGCDIGAVEVAQTACPASPQSASLAAGSLAGAEGVVAVAPLGLQALLRRRRRSRDQAVPRGQRVRSVVTWLMVAGVAVAVLAACQPVKKTPPIC
jgi:hypothetical protein